MMDLTLEQQIDKFLVDNKYGELITIQYDNFSVNIKTTLSESEKRKFIEYVVEKSYIDGIKYSPIDEKLASIEIFAKMLTDLPIPVKQDDSGTVDIDKLYAMIGGLNLIAKAKFTSGLISNLLNELESCINKEIAFKNQKLIAVYSSSTAGEEAIDAISSVMYKFNDFLNVVINQLEKNGGKLAKYLTPKKLNEFFNNIQKAVVDKFNKEDKNSRKNNTIQIHREAL